MKLSILLALPLCICTNAHLRQRAHSRLTSYQNDKLRQQADDINTTQRKSSPPFKLTLHNHKGVQYNGAVTLGTQELRAIYDTGSFEVMVISKECSVCKLDHSLPPYDSDSSDTFKAGDRARDGAVADHHFAGGTVRARRDYETVHVGSSDSTIKVENMPFWQVVDTNMKVFLNRQASFTAIVGLGHRSKPPDEPSSESFIERTGTQKFAICLLPGIANPGYLTFNPAHDYADPSFQKIAVIGENHWAVTLNTVSSQMDGVKVSSCNVYGGQRSCVAIVDSGTSLIGVPRDAAPMINGLIQQIQYDCSNLDELPDLIFELDGKAVSFAGPQLRRANGSE